jgi:ABC-type dipeptide/oligopeptide/nickel transport system permease subunit
MGRYRVGPTGFLQMSWGLMLYLAYHMGYFMGDNLIKYWWLSFPAGLAVTLLASAFYLVGRGFNQIANPRLGAR